MLSCEWCGKMLPGGPAARHKCEKCAELEVQLKAADFRLLSHVYRFVLRRIVNG